MLQKLVSKLEPFCDERPIIFIEDSSDLPDLSLFYAMVFNKAALYKSCHIVLLEHSKEDFFEATNGTIPTQITVHECYHHDFMTKYELEEKLQKIICCLPAEELIICFDSLNPWIQLVCASSVIHTLRQLQHQSHIKEIMAVIHTDLLSESVKKQFSKIASTTLLLSKKYPSDSDTSNLVCYGKILKPSGKIVSFAQSFTVFNDFEIETKTWLSHKTIKLERQNESIASPSCIATFDIATNKEETLQKNLLVLPYTKMNQSGSITYEVDSNDDLDCDDPDEDLGF